jgi:hypothetical protein
LTSGSVLGSGEPGFNGFYPGPSSDHTCGRFFAENMLLGSYYEKKELGNPFEQNKVFLCNTWQML